MDGMDYNKTKENAQRRKADLLQRQQEIPLEKKRLDEELEKNKRELIGLDQILDGLEFMNSDIPPDFEPSGFTDIIRKLLSETTLPLVPTQIRDALEAKGITGSSSKNLLINVHKVLERIDSELEKMATADGKFAYKRKLPWTAAEEWRRVHGERVNKMRLPYGQTVPPPPDYKDLTPLDAPIPNPGVPSLPETEDVDDFLNRVQRGENKKK
jgi:hypothetical protein